MLTKNRAILEETHIKFRSSNPQKSEFYSGTMKASNMLQILECSNRYANSSKVFSLVEGLKSRQHFGKFDTTQGGVFRNSSLNHKLDFRIIHEVNLRRCLK